MCVCVCVCASLTDVGSHQSSGEMVCGQIVFHELVYDVVLSVRVFTR